jgi:hypothetical protein
VSETVGLAVARTAPFAGAVKAIDGAWLSTVTSSAAAAERFPAWSATVAVLGLLCHRYRRHHSSCLQ